MPKIIEEAWFDGTKELVERLGLTPLIAEVREIVTSFELRLEEVDDVNSGAAVRRLLDSQFDKKPGWNKKQTGDIDWTKCKSVNGTRVCVGVAIRVSDESDWLIVDMLHLTTAVREGLLDAGVVIVPSDRLSRYFTGRGPCFSDARKDVGLARLEDSPLILFAIEHDGAGPGLAKQAKKTPGTVGRVRSIGSEGVYPFPCETAH